VADEVVAEGPACPLPAARYERIVMGHGGGGTLGADLVREVFLAEFGGPSLDVLEDQATLDWDASAAGAGTADARKAGDAGARPAFTTDSFVVKPLFFPGGDIGRLAVHGTVNDLAVGGAVPKYLSAAFILEEGLAVADLRRIARSMREACEEAGVRIVTGDTKVVDRGKGDQVYIATSGLGIIPPGRRLSIGNARAGDQVLLSGTIGDHGIAIMASREGLEFETELRSDTAALGGLTQAMLAACPTIRAMRDPTRGGLAATLNELAGASRVGVIADEARIPVRPEVRAACEMLGLDPLHVANEGKLIAVVPREDAPRLLETMRAHPLGRDAERIGEIVADHPRTVVMRSVIGGLRVVATPAGELLPRIC
jgi:hydrogenase expression/formation protein HypE